MASSFGTSQFGSLTASPWPLLTGCPGGMLGRGTKPGRAASVGASRAVTQGTYLRRTIRIRSKMIEIHRNLICQPQVMESGHIIFDISEHILHVTRALIARHKNRHASLKQNSGLHLRTSPSPTDFVGHFSPSPPRTRLQATCVRWPFHPSRWRLLWPNEIQ